MQRWFQVTGKSLHPRPRIYVIHIFVMSTIHIMITIWKTIQKYWNEENESNKEVPLVHWVIKSKWNRWLNFYWNCLFIIYYYYYILKVRSSVDTWLGEMHLIGWLHNHENKPSFSLQFQRKLIYSFIEYWIFDLRSEHSTKISKKLLTEFLVQFNFVIENQLNFTELIRTSSHAKKN